MSQLLKKVLSLTIRFFRENGDFGAVTALPPHPRLSPPEGEEQREQQQEERAPVAFRENGLLKPLSGVEDIESQQSPGQTGSVQMVSTGTSGGVIL